MGGADQEAALRRAQLHGRLAGRARGSTASRSRPTAPTTSEDDEALLARQPDKRPTMEEVITLLDANLSVGTGSGEQSVV